MNLLIMGVAGSGKGTMSRLIVEEYDIPHISTGDMFRQAMAAETEIGLVAKNYIDHGLLVPDDLTVEIMKNRIQQDDCQNGYLIDGFPRTEVQAKALEDMTNGIGRPLEKVINLIVDIDDLAPRITGRRVCSSCGEIYNVYLSPSKVEGVCDKCGGTLIQRSDDTMEQLAIRLGEHAVLTKPVLDFYEKQGIVVNINASGDIDSVWQQIKVVLEQMS